jgi:hypothetical protein
MPALSPTANLRSWIASATVVEERATESSDRRGRPRRGYGCASAATGNVALSSTGTSVTRRTVDRRDMGRPAVAIFAGTGRLQPVRRCDGLIVSEQVVGGTDGQGGARPSGTSGIGAGLWREIIRADSDSAWRSVRIRIGRLAARQSRGCGRPSRQSRRGSPEARSSSTDEFRSAD